MGVISKIIVVMFLLCLAFSIAIIITYLITTSYENTRLNEHKKNKVYVKYISPIPPLNHNIKGDWIDLRSAEKVDLKAGEYRCIKLGVAMELPKGYSAIIVPRSSTFKHWGVIQTNSIGIIDHSYCGDGDEWMLPIYATRDTTINYGERICQFRLLKNYSAFDFETVESLCNPDRGGFGSTGVD